MKVTSHLGCFVTLLALASCAPPLRGPQPVPEPLAYRPAIRAAQRKARVYRRFLTSLDARVTFLSWDVRLARLAAAAETGRWIGEELERLRSREMELGERYVEFLVATYASREDWVKLDRDEPTWLLRLESGELELAPLEIDTWEPTLEERWLFFPEITPWAHLYRVRFDRFHPSDGQDMLAREGGFRLVFESLMGRTSCRWRFRDDRRAPAH